MQAGMVIATGLAALLLALVHLTAGKLRFLEGIPRSRWLSLAGGVSVAYVFLHLLPELAAGQEHLEDAPLAEQLSYLVALGGLTLFYGLERAAIRRRSAAKRGALAAPADVFWLHLGSFAVYNALIGYLLLHLEEQDPLSVLWYVVAMALHFVVNDFGLREHHRARYERLGRWLLAVAVLLGWLAGLAGEISHQVLAVLFAFLAGGVVLNVLKEELPEERESRFGAFALGVGGYATLLLLAG